MPSDPRAGRSQYLDSGKKGISLTRVFDADTWQSGTGVETADEVRVPVAEEWLQVGKTVTKERQTVPVTLRQEEVRVEGCDIADRPLRAGEEAFREGIIRVPVRGEEAVGAKETVVTGEVVVNRAQTTRQGQVSDTVRRERMDVDENYRAGRVVPPPVAPQ